MKTLAEITLEELREIVREEIRAAANMGKSYSKATLPPGSEPLNLPVLDVGDWHDNLSLKREELY